MGTWEQVVASSQARKRRERGANLRGSEEGSKTMELDLIMEWKFEEGDCLEKRLNSTERKWCKERTLVNQRQSRVEFLPM